MTVFHNLCRDYHEITAILEHILELCGSGILEFYNSRADSTILQLWNSRIVELSEIVEFQNSRMCRILEL